MKKFLIIYTAISIFFFLYCIFLVESRQKKEITDLKIFYEEKINERDIIINKYQLTIDNLDSATRKIFEESAINFE